MSENNESRKPSTSTAEKTAPSNVMKLYSDCYVGESMTQHFLYGIKASVTEEGFLCIDAPMALAESNQDRNFPLHDELTYRKMIKDISKSRR